MTTNWLKAGQVDCPHCLAKAGNPCVGEYGDPLEWAPAHISRVILAENPPCHICGHPVAAYGPCDHPGTVWEAA